jgi:nucleoid-associated protein YgaU
MFDSESGWNQLEPEPVAPATGFGASPDLDSTARPGPLDRESSDAATSEQNQEEAWSSSAAVAELEARSSDPDPDIRNAETEAGEPAERLQEASGSGSAGADPEPGRARKASQVGSMIQGGTHLAGAVLKGLGRLNPRARVVLVSGLSILALASALVARRGRDSGEAPPVTAIPPRNGQANSATTKGASPKGRLASGARPAAPNTAAGAKDNNKNQRGEAAGTGRANLAGAGSTGGASESSAPSGSRPDSTRKPSRGGSTGVVLAMANDAAAKARELDGTPRLNSDAAVDGPADPDADEKDGDPLVPLPAAGLIDDEDAPGDGLDVPPLPHDSDEVVPKPTSDGIPQPTSSEPPTPPPAPTLTSSAEIPTPEISDDDEVPEPVLPVGRSRVIPTSGDPSAAPAVVKADGDAASAVDVKPDSATPAPMPTSPSPSASSAASDPGSAAGSSSTSTPATPPMPTPGAGAPGASDDKPNPSGAAAKPPPEPTSGIPLDPAPGARAPSPTAPAPGTGADPASPAAAAATGISEPSVTEEVDKGDASQTAGATGAKPDGQSNPSADEPQPAVNPEAGIPGMDLVADPDPILAPGLTPVLETTPDSNATENVARMPSLDPAPDTAGSGQPRSAVSAPLPGADLGGSASTGTSTGAGTEAGGVATVAEGTGAMSAGSGAALEAAAPSISPAGLLPVGVAGAIGASAGSSQESGDEEAAGPLSSKAGGRSPGAPLPNLPEPANSNPNNGNPEAYGNAHAGAIAGSEAGDSQLADEPQTMVSNTASPSARSVGEPATPAAASSPAKKDWVVLTNERPTRARDLDADNPRSELSADGTPFRDENEREGTRSQGTRRFEIETVPPTSPASAAADSGASTSGRQQAESRVETVPHTVEEQENFWTISRLYYGSGRYYKALWQANRATHPRIDEIAVGDTIIIPAQEDLDPTYILPPQAAEPVPSPARRAAGPRKGEVSTTSSQRQGVPLKRSSRTAVELNLPVDDVLRDNRSRSTPRTFAADEGLERGLSPADAPIHKVRPGETVRSIARDRLGDSRRADEILEINRKLIDDPYNLVPGQILELPEDAKLGRPRR